MILAIIIGILTFLILVLIHEFGHFIAAKKSGVKVLEFGIGIPPKLFTLGRDKGGTEYTLNLLPFGGFVRLKGESPDNKEEFLAKDSFITQPLYKKLAILIGGVFMNFILAIFLFWIGFLHGVKPMGVFPYGASHSYLIPSLDFAVSQGLISGKKEDFYPKIIYVVTGDNKYLAYRLGLQSGDIILKINGQDVNFISLKKVLGNYCGKQINLKVKKFDGNIVNLKGNLGTGNYCKLGVIPMPAGKIEFKTIKFGVIGSFKASFQETIQEIRLTFVMLKSLFIKLLSLNKEQVKQAIYQFSGPVGAVKVGQIILNEYGFWQYLIFAAMISLALAIFNILPIPALDGGRLLSVIIQSVFRLNPTKYFEIESRINIVFFIILMSFGIYIMWLDLQRFWGIGL